MMNTSNGIISAPSSSSSTAAIKTYFKTPKGKYKLHYEKTHSSSLPFHYSSWKNRYSVVTACRDGHIKIWTRPSISVTRSASLEANPTSALLRANDILNT